MRKFAFLLTVFLGFTATACGGSSDQTKAEKSETKPASDSLTVAIDMNAMTVGGKSHTLVAGDTAKRAEVVALLTNAISSTDQRVHVTSTGDVNFGFLGFVVDEIARQTSWTELSVDGSTRFKMRAIPSDTLRDPYLVVSPKREKPIAVQCPDPCQPSLVVIAQPASAPVRAVWAKTGKLTSENYTWWLNPDYGNIWREQLKAQKPTLGKCVNDARMKHNIGPIDVSFEFTIERTGTVSDIDFRAFEGTYQPIYDCVTTAVKKIQMPRSHKMDVTFTYSFGGSE